MARPAEAPSTESLLLRADLLLEATLTAEDAAPSALLGVSVALDGDRAVVGATGDSEADSSAGAAYVYDRVDGVWAQTAKLIGSRPVELGWVGRSVAVDGDVVVVGGHRYNDYTGIGYAFVLDEDGVWQEETRFTAQSAREFDNFGFDVALDGNTAVIGAPLDDATGDQTDDSGAAYVFVREGQSWSRTRLTADDGASGDLFGISVDIDGDRIVVGAQNTEASDLSGGRGAVYVFRRDGSDWAQESRLVADDTLGGDFYGRSVAIEGDRVLVGDPSADATIDSTGAVYEFVRDGQTWTQRSRIVADEATSSTDSFGTDVALKGDRAVVGATGASPRGLPTGVAYTFVRTDERWTQEATLVPEGGQSGDAFGFDVTLDGERVLAGARGTNGAAGFNTGAAYVFLVSSPVNLESSLEAHVFLDLYPNPTSTRATVQWEQVQTGPARLSLHDVLGREVAVLEEGTCGTGTHSAVVPVERLAPGVYVVRLVSLGAVATRSLTVVR
ncbi:T9SS type A sorting domain-containing protein, partial [Rubrivirga sp.]|uniref:T9SS type A sorting domain-containing protein n=1 Tax=Rubrivirga sp. TaxID=1885344 RepID=UPI003C70ADD9